MKNLTKIPGITVFDNNFLFDDKIGRFKINNGNNFYLVIATDGEGFEHVSVTRHRNNGANIPKCPTLDEMKKIKNIFFNEDEIVYQIFPSKEKYINEHPYCLHLWRPNYTNFVIPPEETENDKIIESNTIQMNGYLCHYKIVDLEDWTLLKTYITQNNLKPIKSGPTWEQLCEIKETIFGTNDACAEFMTTTEHEDVIKIYLPKNPDLLILPPSILVGHVKKLTK